MKTKDEQQGETFDVHQGQGSHLATVNPCETTEQFVCIWLRKTVEEGDILWRTKDPISCSLGPENPDRMKFLAIGRRADAVRAIALLAVVEEGKSNTVVSAYPECDGSEVSVKLTAIHEWAAGCEATLEGTVLGENECRIAFFDTRYARMKEAYRIGETYVFRLAAFAYGAEVVPEAEREFRIEGEAAAKRRMDLGQEPEFEADGSVKPLVFRMDRMVAFLRSSEAYPDDAEFYSPVYGRVRRFQAFGLDFYRLNVAIARDEGGDSPDVVIPLVAKTSLFSVKPKANDPVRGHLWLQGYCMDANRAG